MNELTTLTASLGTRLKERKETLAVAESSAGGLISAALLAVPGASAYFLGGAVIYTQTARRALLRVPDESVKGVRSSTKAYALLKARAIRELARALAGFGLEHQCTTADRARPSANRLLIAARWPLRRLRLRSEPDEPGRWLSACVEAPRPLTLGAIHVPNRASGRKDVFYADILTLLGRWRRGPLLLLGDTNSGRRRIDEETPVFGPKEEAWLDALEHLGWLDAFRLARGRARAYTWYSPNRGNGFRIDQAFVNHALRPRLRDV